MLAPTSDASEQMTTSEVESDEWGISTLMSNLTLLPESPPRSVSIIANQALH